MPPETGCLEERGQAPPRNILVHMGGQVVHLGMRGGREHQEVVASQLSSHLAGASGFTSRQKPAKRLGNHPGRGEGEGGRGVNGGEAEQVYLRSRG